MKNLIFLTLILLFVVSCSKIILHPIKIPKNANPPPEVIEKFFESESGNKLHSVFVGKKSQGRSVIYFHGNSKNIYKRYDDFLWMADSGMGYHVLGYSGFGKSEGKAQLESIIIDIKSFISKTMNENPSDNFVLIGTSFGGAALLSALGDFDQNHKISLLIIDSSFDNYEKLAAHYMKKSIVGYPFSFLPYLFFDSELNPDGVISKIKSQKNIVSHCKNDEEIPINFGRRLFQKLNGKKEFWEASDCGHSQTFNSHEFRSKLLMEMQKIAGQ